MTLNDTFDLSTLTASLEPGPEGIWVARSRSQISYPQEGNQNCLALEADSFWFEHRSRCIEAAVRRFPPTGMVLDIGGGNGYVAVGLQRAGIPVTLVEPGWQGAWNARQRGVENVICAALEDADFYPQSLPAVGLFDVLEHIEDDAAFLKSLYNLLSPDGKLYLTVPAYPALWSADDRYACHYRRYTVTALKQRLREAGFTTVFATYIFWMLPLPIFLLRSLPSRLGLRKEDAWDQYHAEHRERGGFAGKLLKALLNWELNRLQKGRAVGLGGSCLVVASKE